MAIEVDPEWWKTLFDEVYLMTDARSVCDDELTKREVDLILEVLPISPSHLILDLCGGHGRHSIELASRGFGRCSVVDFSQSLIEHGKKLAAGRGVTVEFIRADARETGLASGRFDRVLILGNSLGYLPEPDDDRSILCEAQRVMKPGGRLLLDVADAGAGEGMAPSSWHEIGDLVVCREREHGHGRVCAREMVICKKEGLVRDRTYSIRIYEPEGLSAMLLESGFEDIEVHSDFRPQDRPGDYGFMNNRMLICASNPSGEERNN